MSNTSNLQVVHDGTTITYNENTDTWEFTLRGRDRTADSLAKAKEFIDKPVPANKAKPFEKIPAWFMNFDNAPVKVVVTGIADKGWRSEEQVWITNGKTRSKEYAYHVYPQNEKNDPIMASIVEKRATVGKILDEARKLKQKLSPLVLPKDE